MDTLHLTSNISEIESLVNKLLDKNIVNIAISFEDNSYLCSSSGAIIIRCWEIIKQKGGDFILLNVNSDIHEFLAILDLENLIKAYDTDEIIDSF